MRQTVDAPQVSTCPRPVIWTVPFCRTPTLPSIRTISAFSFVMVVLTFNNVKHPDELLKTVQVCRCLCTISC
jgi:hypothetical protein